MRTGRAVFIYCDLEFVWELVLGIWDFNLVYGMPV